MSFWPSALSSATSFGWQPSQKIVILKMDAGLCQRAEGVTDLRQFELATQ